MENYEKKLFYQAKFLPRAVKEKGFINLFLLPIAALIMTGIMGLAGLSLGIKNITKAQSLCFQVSLNTQKKLGEALKEILSLNKQVSFLHAARKKIEIAIVSSALAGAAPLASKLAQQLNKIKTAQRFLIIRQNSIILKSRRLKLAAASQIKQHLKKLKSSNIQEDTFLKKALALKKKKQGDLAYIYKPLPDFINQQKIQFSWRLKPFYPLSRQSLLLIKEQEDWIHYSCAASLKHSNNYKPVLYANK